MLMSTLGAQNEDLTMKVLDSLRKFVRYVTVSSKYTYMYLTRHKEKIINRLFLWVSCESKVCIRAKWPIRLELIPVSVP